MARERSWLHGFILNPAVDPEISALSGALFNW